MSEPRSILFTILFSVILADTTNTSTTKTRHAGATKKQRKIYAHKPQQKNKCQKIAEQNSTQKTATKKEK
jgi:hypothetical protein